MANNIENRVIEVKKSYFKAFLMSLNIIMICLLAAFSFNTFHITIPKILQIIGYICWGTTFGANDWEILTWSRRSPAEMLHKKLDKIFTICGFVAFVLSCIFD